MYHLQNDSRLMVDDSTSARELSLADIEVGQSVQQVVTFGPEAMIQFQYIANDLAPLHHDDKFAQSIGFNGKIIQGLLVSSRFSRLIGMYLPGTNTVLQSIEFRYKKPITLGMELNYLVVVERVIRAAKAVKLNLSVSYNGDVHVNGQCQCLIKKK